MAGVALVGYSGSLIKDAVKEAVNSVILSRFFSPDADLPPPQPIETPEATAAVIGVFFILFAQVL